MKEKEKIVKEIITIQVADAVAVTKAIIDEEDAEDAEDAEEDAAEEETAIVSICKMLNVLIVAKRTTFLSTAQLQEKNDNEHSNMVSKSDFKNLFQSSLKEILTKKDKQAKKKENTEGND
jgi:hypothetical protein